MKGILTTLGWIYVGANCFVFALSMMVAMTGWWPSTWQVPWSDVGSFVETKDGLVLVEIRMWGRIQHYDRHGKFLQSWPRHFSHGDSVLATDETGAVYLQGVDTVFKLDDSGKVEKKYRSGSSTSRNWELSGQTGEPQYAPERSQAVQRRIAKKGQILFSENGSRDFLCPDGTDLVRNGASLMRLSPSGEKLMTFQAPWYYRPFEFPFPAALAGIVAVILLILKLHKENQNR